MRKKIINSAANMEIILLVLNATIGPNQTSATKNPVIILAGNAAIPVIALYVPIIIYWALSFSFEYKEEENSIYIELLTYGL